MTDKMVNEILQKNDNLSKNRLKRSYIIASLSKFVILKDYGFGLVTCADWMWEFSAWICLLLIINTSTAIVFGFVWFVYINNKARQRNWNYIAEF